MAGLLHLPQGGAQIVVVSEIPEVPVPGGTATIEDILVTLGQYTQVVSTDGTYSTPQEIWDRYPDWEKLPQNGDMCIINASKHNGLNFQPSSGDVPIKVDFMYIDRILNFASNRIIAQAQVDEADWGQSRIFIHLIPFVASNTLNQDIARVKAYLNGGQDSGISTLTFLHSGSANDEIGLMLGEIPSAGKYKVAISVNPAMENLCPSIYSLNFRTY